MSALVPRKTKLMALYNLELELKLHGLTRPESTAKTFHYSEISNKIIVSKQEINSKYMLECEVQQDSHRK